MKPKISYVICATPRSGSHFLGEALQSTGLAGVPDEYFHNDDQGRLQNQTGHIAQHHGQMTLDEFSDFVLEFGSTPNGVFGVTIHPKHFASLLKNYQELPQYKELEAHELLNALLHNPKYIWITRRDKVRQAVSLFKAMQTDIWKKPTGINARPKKQPTFDYISIEHCRMEIEKSEQNWADFFKRHNVTPFTVVYEDLVDSYEQTTLKIIDYLHIPYPENLTFAPRRLQKQADNLNNEWVSQYQYIQQSRFHNLTLFFLKLRWKLGKITIRRWLHDFLKRESLK